MGKTWTWRRKNIRKVSPVVKKCVNCRKRRVKYHHFVCERCWRKNEEVKERLRERMLNQPILLEQ